MAIILVRTLIIYLTVVLCLRLMGKRQLGELELSEFVVAVIISDLAANPLQDTGTPLLNGLIPIVVLLCLELLISGLVVKSVSFRKLLFGKPSMLVVHGKIDQAQMRKNRFTLDELMEELRGKDITDLSTVQYAILECNGTLSTILYPAERPVTAGQMGAPTSDAGYPMILVSDGKILDHNLRLAGRSRAWLDKELAARKLNPDAVYLMTINGAGQVYFAAKEGTV